ncbi:MAG: hypothetical protein IPM59_11490 [Chloracidobacterium sp.]|nr:hypothetical protein [Chloracidobacterium sp.]
MIDDGQSSYVLPSPQLLIPADPQPVGFEDNLRSQAARIIEVLAAFELYGQVVHISPGPVFSVFDFKPEPGTTAARLAKRAEDISLAFHGRSVRVTTAAGKSQISIEVQNEQPEIVRLRELLESRRFCESASLLTLATGRTIDGSSYVVDLSALPHLLVGGSTGSGKSSSLHSIILSILFKARPDEVKLILIDPRRVELGLYSDIPHLATPVIADAARAAVALEWAVAEVNRRYKDLAGYGAANIANFNQEVVRRNSLEQWDDDGKPHLLLPYLVIVIDEIGELLARQASISDTLSNVAAAGRAVGIHLIATTGRPSSEVITPEIKANFPARLAFSTVSRSDSRTIIDSHGAEELLGNGDALFLPPKAKELIRLQGTYSELEEVKRVVEFVKVQGRPDYAKFSTDDEDSDLPGRRDPLFVDALRCAVQAKRASTSLFQRHLRIGYGRAAAILDAMVREGYVGDMDGTTRARPILPKAYENLPNLDEDATNEFAADHSIEQPNSTPDSTSFGIAGAISVFFFVVTLLLGVMSCSGKDMSPLLCLTPVTLLIALVAGAIEVAGETGGGTAYHYTPPTGTGRGRGRPRKLFGRSRKSSIIKMIKRDIRKYGD